MSLASFGDYIKKITTETSSTNAENPRSAALAIDKSLKGEAAVAAVAEKLAADAKKAGYDVSSDEVKSYIDGLKVQYETNPQMAAMMDVHCSTTCHIGSAVGKG